MKAIVNANIVLEQSIIYDGVMLIDDGRIIGFGEKGKVAVCVPHLMVWCFYV